MWQCWITRVAFIADFFSPFPCHYNDFFFFNWIGTGKFFSSLQKCFRIQRGWGSRPFERYPNARRFFHMMAFLSRGPFKSSRRHQNVLLCFQTKQGRNCYWDLKKITIKIHWLVGCHTAQVIPSLSREEQIIKCLMTDDG